MVKFCFNTMVKNEAPRIRRMLDSIYQYIDYWVIQDNGSTDGTQDIINDFFKEKGIPGFLYQIDWWEGHGINRNHALQTALKSKHECDWILRVDADEELIVEKDFDWSVFNDLNVQSFNITAQTTGSFYTRTWIWNAKLPWEFKPDRAHETIFLPDVGENFQRVQLDKKIRHFVHADGMTYEDPLKYLKDALNLELDQVTTKRVLEDSYHLWYLAKSYFDVFNRENDLPYGREHVEEYARRVIFYFRMFLEQEHNYLTNFSAKREDEMAYVAFFLIGDVYKVLNNYEYAILNYKEAEKFCSVRNENKIRLYHLYLEINQKERAKEILDQMELNKHPYPDRVFLLENWCYKETNPNFYDMYNIFKENKIKFPGIN